MDKFLLRSFLFSMITLILVLPLYVALKFNAPSALFFYAPVVGLIVSSILEFVERGEDKEEINEIRR